MLRALLIDPSLLRFTLLAFAGILLIIAYFLHRARKKRAAGQQGVQDAHIAQYYPPVPRRSTWVAETFRVIVLLVALLVAGSLVLILLPDEGMERVTDYFRSGREATPASHMLGFLYLGDEIRGNEFHVRGVVRNISSTPIEQLDVLVRLYGTDGRLLETAVIRTDSERLLPDETSQFHLTYPKYQGQFGSYSVDFKLRQGDLVPYKDMRTQRDRS